MSALFRNTIVADAYATHRDRVDREFMEVIDSMVLRGKKVIDIGAGAGAPADYLARQGHDVVALEPSPAMIARGMQRHPGLEFIRGYGENLPLKDKSVGTAILMYVMHHADDPVAVLSEARRVLTDDGRAIVVSGDADSPRQQMFREYFPTLLPDLPSPDEIFWWACEATMSFVSSTTEVHWVYPHSLLDDSYIDMVSSEMFETLRSLNPKEFETGVQKMRADRGRPLLPPQVNVITLEPASLAPFLEDEQPFELVSSYRGRSLSSTRT